jgi:serine/threonine protein kinase
VDHRSDIFSLGVVAYEFFLGRKPFVAESLPLLSHKIHSEFPEAPCKIIPGFPPKLQAILARMIKKRPEDRYQSAEEIVSDFKDFLSSNPRAASPRFESESATVDWS